VNVAVISRPRTEVSPRALAWSLTRNAHGAQLVCRGEVRGRDLTEFAAVLDRLILASDDQVCVDLSAVDDWSLLAQAMLLSANRRLRSRGRRLVLVGPSATLRRNTHLIDVFGLITTIDESPASPESSPRGGDSEVASAGGVGGVGPPGQATRRT
jgi:anti-anti-sigma regulatory factor